MADLDISIVKSHLTGMRTGGTDDDKGMTLDRRVKIIDLIETQGQVKVNELSQTFGVSEVTIRNDLAHLEGKGLLFRTRGGGIRNQRVNIDFRLDEKAMRHLPEKKVIGKKAAKLVKDDETIILDSGTTTLEVAKNLSHVKNLTVITNALNVAGQLLEFPDVNVIMLGGMLRRSSLSMIGPIAERNIGNYYCDKVIMGVDSISAQHGISTPTIEEAQLNRMMIDISKEVIIVTDSSKFLKRSFAYIVPMSMVDVVVTDSGISREEHDRLIEAGVTVLIA